MYFFILKTPLEKTEFIGYKFYLKLYSDHRQIFLKSHSCNVVERVKNEEKVHESENSIHVGMILIENENAIKIDTTSDDPKNDPLDIKSENA